MNLDSVFPFHSFPVDLSWDCGDHVWSGRLIQEAIPEHKGSPIRNTIGGNYPLISTAIFQQCSSGIVKVNHRETVGRALTFNYSLCLDCHIPEIAAEDGRVAMVWG